MITMKKCALSAILAIVIVFSVSIPASAAAPNEDIDQTYAQLNDESIVPYAGSEPTYGNVASFPYQAELTDLAANKGSYTRYCFVTSTGRLSLTCEFVHSGTSSSLTRSLEIKLYRYDTWYDDGGNFHYYSTLVDTKTMNASAGTRSTYFSGLSANTEYFFLFRNTSDTSSNNGYDISGTITIDD